MDRIFPEHGNQKECNPSSWTKQMVWFEILRWLLGTITGTWKGHNSWPVESITTKMCLLVQMGSYIIIPHLKNVSINFLSKFLEWGDIIYTLSNILIFVVIIFWLLCHPPILCQEFIGLSIILRVLNWTLYECRSFSFCSPWLGISHLVFI